MAPRRDVSERSGGGWLHAVGGHPGLRKPGDVGFFTLKNGDGWGWCIVLTCFNMLSATLTFAQTHDCDITEQYVDWGNNINFIFMRDQNQEGGTSTPGKRPGCSEHALTCLNYFKLHFKDFRFFWGLSDEYGDYGS